MFHFLFVCVFASVPLEAQRRPDFKELLKSGVGHLSEYLKIDTSNPPGREFKAAEYLAQILRREGINAKILKSGPGRANVYARLRGRVNNGGLILLSHLDVVPAETDGWLAPPFAGEVSGGFVWGRGAIDAKGLGIAHLQVLIALKRLGMPLERDVVFLATADEESGGGAGMVWLLRKHPEIFTGMRYALGEGGVTLTRDNRLAHVGVEVTQKLPVWLRLTARGAPGHASVPTRDTAPHRLVRGLDRIIRHRTPLQVTPFVSQYFKDLAPLQPPELRDGYLNLEESVHNDDFVRQLDAGQLALLRNTAALTVSRIGLKTNAIPGEAVAELDCRLLPGEDVDRFVTQLSEVLADPNIEVNILLSGKTAASPVATPLFDAIRNATARIERKSSVGPLMMTGFSDSRFLREQGIIAYGFDPFRISAGLSADPHARNERLAIPDLDFAIRYLYEVVSEFVQ